MNGNIQAFLVPLEGLLLHSCPHRSRFGECFKRQCCHLCCSDRDKSPWAAAAFVVPPQLKSYSELQAVFFWAPLSVSAPRALIVPVRTGPWQRSRGGLPTAPLLLGSPVFFVCHSFTLRWAIWVTAPWQRWPLGLVSVLVAACLCFVSCFFFSPELVQVKVRQGPVPEKQMEQQQCAQWRILNTAVNRSTKTTTQK